MDCVYSYILPENTSIFRMPQLIYNEYGRLITYPCAVKGCPNQIPKEIYGYYGACVHHEVCQDCTYGDGWRM